MIESFLEEAGTLYRHFYADENSSEAIFEYEAVHVPSSRVFADRRVVVLGGAAAFLRLLNHWNRTDA